MDLYKVFCVLEIFKRNEDFSGYANCEETPFFMVTIGSYDLKSTQEISFSDFVTTPNTDRGEKLAIAQKLTRVMTEKLYGSSSHESKEGFCLVEAWADGEYVIVTVVAPIEVSPYMANRLMLALKHSKWPLSPQDIRRS